MVLPGRFIYSHTFDNVKDAERGRFVGPPNTFNGIRCRIWCWKMFGSEWKCLLQVSNNTHPSLGLKVEFRIRTKNGVETVGMTDGRIQNDSRFHFRNDPKYFVDGNLTIECHVKFYEIDENGVRNSRTVIENKSEIRCHDQRSQLVIEEKDLQTAISLSKKEFEQQKAKEQQKKKETLSCNICLQEYGEEGDRTPRVLDCGHTLCLGCCKQIVQPNQIQCPFCRVVTHLTGRTISNLPKNYLALSM